MGLQLEAGRRYRNRKGEEIEIVRYAPDVQPEWPYFGDNRLSYRPDGTWRVQSGLQSNDDLVEEIFDEPPLSNAPLSNDPTTVVRIDGSAAARPPIIGRAKTVAFDVDETLIQRLPYDGYRHVAEDDRFEIQGVHYRIRRDEVYRLRSFAGSNGFEVVVWSAGGGEWAAQIGGILGLDPYVDLYLGKPDFAVDDRADFGITKDRWIPAYTTTDAKRYSLEMEEEGAA
jgi:hypothetical protein